jgi:hypothetical protein
VERQRTMRTEEPTVEGADHRRMMRGGVTVASRAQGLSRPITLSLGQPLKISENEPLFLKKIGRFSGVQILQSDQFPPNWLINQPKNGQKSDWAPTEFLSHAPVSSTLLHPPPVRLALVAGGSACPLAATARPRRRGSGTGQQRYRLAGPGGTAHRWDRRAVVT